jgi:hypothetical protein
MFKKRIIALITAVLLCVAVAGASTVVTDSLGLSTTSPAFACPASGGAGGGC